MLKCQDGGFKLIMEFRGSGGTLSADPEQGFHIFLSYRREGTSAHAGRLHDFLISGVDDQPGFDDDQIFMDIDTIQPGDDLGKSSPTQLRVATSSWRS